MGDMDDPEILQMLEGVAPGDDEGEDKEESGTVEKSKNWSSVNLCCQETKIAALPAIPFTNWLWWRCIRPKLEETKSSLDDLSEEDREKYSIDLIEEVLGEHCPALVEKK